MQKCYMNPIQIYVLGSVLKLADDGADLIFKDNRFHSFADAG